MKKIGFSETIIVMFIVASVFVVGVLVFKNHKKRMLAGEGIVNLQKLLEGQIQFYTVPNIGRDGQPQAPKFVSCGPTPEEVPKASAVSVEWKDIKCWRAIRFGLSLPTRYQFQAIATGENDEARATIRAIADLDGDGTFAIFERRLAVNSEGEVVEEGLLQATNPYD